MKFRITTIILFLTIGVYSQNTQPYPTIQVIGNSEKLVMPDIGVLSLQIAAKKIEFNDAISALDKKTAEVKKQLQKINFKKDDLKTRAFNIRKNTIYDRNKRRDSGYVASQNILVEFKNNEDRISEILTEFAEESVGMQLSFSFKLSNELKNATKEDLMTASTLDAKRKAKLLAESLGKELDEILTISYGSAPVSTVRPVMRTAMMSDESAKYSAPVSGFTPEELKLSERVYVSWILK